MLLGVIFLASKLFLKTKKHEILNVKNMRKFSDAKSSLDIESKDYFNVGGTGPIGKKGAQKMTIANGQNLKNCQSFQETGQYLGTIGSDSKKCPKSIYSRYVLKSDKTRLNEYELEK